MLSLVEVVYTSGRRCGRSACFVILVTCIYKLKVTTSTKKQKANVAFLTLH